MIDIDDEHTNLSERSILVADDDEESQELLTEILADHRLVFARNAFEAIRNINAQAFDGYVLDYWLPDWSGVGVCREIRKVDPHAPIVFCTAAARPQDKTRALRAGATAYLVKPYDPQVLRSKLRAFLTLSDLDSLRAKIEEERAVQSELERRLAAVNSSVDAARQLATSSLERTARNKAFKAFVEARGTRAHFDRWWPQVFQSARANRSL